MEFNFGNFTQGSLFADMEDNMEKLAKKQEEKGKPKSEKKTKTKKSTYSKSSKAEKDEEVTCPINVYTPYGVYTANELEGFSGKAKISDLTDWLVKKGFEGLKASFIDLAFVEGNVFMTFSAIQAHKGNTLIQWGEDGAARLTVADGMLCSYFEKDEFEEEEVSVDELTAKFKERESQYEDSSLVYDACSNVAVVVSKDFIPKVAKDSSAKIDTVFIAGEEYLDGDINGTMDTLLEAYIAEHPEYNAVSSSLGFMLINDQYLPIVIKAPSHNKARFHVKGNDSIVEEKERKYKVPVMVRTIFGKFEIKADEIKKESVTVDEVKKYLRSNYEEFRTKKFMLEYIDGAECFQALVFSSQKGSEERIDHAVGSFLVSASLVKEFNFNKDMKIKNELLEEVLDFFKKDLDNEAVVQVWHRKGEGCFTHYPEVLRVNKIYIKYSYAAVRDYIMDDDVELVATIHSHNRMSAIFSTVDDNDELYPGIFVVLGNLDREIPSISVRAGLNGQFYYMDYHELFETERIFQQFGR